MECTQHDNLVSCTCTYASCSRKGKCCECVSYHRDMNELPACFFSPETERTYDRSFGRFIKDRG